MIMMILRMILILFDFYFVDVVLFDLGLIIDGEEGGGGEMGRWGRKDGVMR